MPTIVINHEEILPGCHRTVDTLDFVAQLARVNHHFTLAQANQWIEHYQDSFRDISA